jgi:cyclopropane fatty-acyl-phospholipid synthase-like methyltransferase
VDEGDVLYDLGSGDGRIPITAARRFGIRAVGIDIEPVRIREANANARAAGVTDLVSFRQEDLFEADFGEASVVSLYLLQSLNMKLRPKLLAELRPGTRIVSHAFDMGEDWKPEQVRQVDSSTIYLWTVPER